MELNLSEVWENLPEFGYIQWFAIGTTSLFLVIWTLIIGIVILQFCGRRASQMLQ